LREKKRFAKPISRNDYRLGQTIGRSDSVHH
jgi:hypothetical protein